MAEWVDDFGQRLLNVHEADACMNKSACTIHYPSNHIMGEFPRKWRTDRGFMERICVHGIGHPDPDENLNDDRLLAIHGCDGCCINETP